MPELSRAQVVVYGAIAVALLLVGARAIRAEGGAEPTFAAGAASDSSAGGGFSLSGQASDLVVDVTGAVARPGVYRLPAGSRVDDAVRRAGGVAPGAQLEAINRAARLADGQQVVVPKRGPAGAVAVGPGSEEGPISLGTATVEQLDTIDGIGPVTAQDIVEFRDEHGGLASVDQLDQVSGIGPATMESLRARLQP
ncbi:MAG TPA: ComEA family DNA-binding protein [Solirubrobacterales bacterium]|jgi:competence protein ComEA|nr:ComEA family DNA-binding protein [Solirubrobacterales bacterium]